MHETRFVRIFLEWGLVKHLIGSNFVESLPLFVTALYKCRRTASFNTRFLGFIWGFDGRVQIIIYICCWWLNISVGIFLGVVWLYKLFLGIKSSEEAFPILKKLIRLKWLIPSGSVMTTKMIHGSRNDFTSRTRQHFICVHLRKTGAESSFAAPVTKSCEGK